MAESKIEWTNKTWHAKTAAKRIGVTLEEYLSRLQLGQKWCGGCREWHPKTIFSIDRSRGDGLASSCRGLKDRRPKPTEEQQRKKANATYRKYYAGPAGADIRQRIYARKRSLDPVPGWWREERLRRGCAYCGGTATGLDHFIPVSHGGKSEPGNLVPACTSCNSRKGNSDPMKWVGRLLPEFVEGIGVQPMCGTGALERLGIC